MKTPKFCGKKVLKKSEGKCRICGENNYALLDTHRITPGSEGGKYTYANSVVACSNCHRRVHAGQIIIDRYYLSTDGTYKLRIVEDGIEKFC